MCKNTQEYTKKSKFIHLCGSHFYANMFYLRNSREPGGRQRVPYTSLVGIRGCPIPSLSSGFDQPGLVD